MGFFSFMYADTNNQENLKHGAAAYVCCPDGTYIHESYYDGYGHFGCYDIYDLLVDFNQCYLTEENLKAPTKTDYSERGYRLALIRYQNMKDQIRLLNQGCDSKKMKALFGQDWKRELGIDLFFYGVNIKYPLKITKNKVPYDSIPPSMDDPLQGYYG